MIRIATRPKPTRTKNDDLAGYSGNTFWLMDGATQLVAPDHGLDAAWHVGRLGEAFKDALTQQPDIVLSTLARESIKKVAGEFFAKTGLTVESPQDLRPFSTLVLCRLADDKTSLEYLAVCDSTLAVIGPNGTQAISDNRLEALNPLVKTDTLLREGYGFQSEEFKRAMRNVYDTTANLMNKQGGWDSIGQDETVIDRAITGTLPLSPSDHILLMSDGFTRAVDTLDLYHSWNTLLADMQAKGADSVIDTIRDAEMADSNGKQHPRSSIHDDATVLWIAPSP